MKLLGLALLCALVAACPHNVPQDSHSGEDAKPKGAKTIALDNGEGRVKGIVTYPGGDRVDWKTVEVPEGKRGLLDLKLQWVPPRPGLQLAFDVFNQWNEPVASSKKSASKKSRSRTREAQIENAKGKYFIRIYAVGRGDAGAYKLTVEYSDAPMATIYDPAKLDIADPPKLAELPEVVEVCTDTTFDPKKPGCASYCPKFGAPQGWPACANVCPTPPTIDVQACWATMPCPKPPDERVAHCKPSDWGPCPDKNNPDMTNPNCRVPKDPVFGRIVENQLVGGETQIRISGGSKQGISAKWTAKVLRGTSGESPLSGGEVNIVRVGDNDTLGKVKLSPDQLQSNDRVKFYPPPR